MPTLVSFHAHPDDEAINCGGTMAAAAADGHRVVLVVATRGERGEVPDDLGEGETLADRRVAETHASAGILGVHRVEFLGYVDSGMAGAEGNDDPACFWRADVDEAAGRLAAILAEESAEALTIYDHHGVYDHPDHVQVHRVGVRAAELAGTPRVYEATLDQDHLAGLLDRADELGFALPTDASELRRYGSPGDAVTTVVDVRHHLDTKRRAMAAHASQISETSFFLAMPPGAFDAVWGDERYIRRGAPVGTAETGLFDDGPS